MSFFGGLKESEGMANQKVLCSSSPHNLLRVSGGPDKGEEGAFFQKRVQNYNKKLDCANIFANYLLFSGFSASFCASRKACISC